MGKWSFTDVTFSKEHDDIVEQVKQMPIEEVIREVGAVFKRSDIETMLSSFGLSCYSGSSGDGWACIDNSAASHYDYKKQPLRWWVDYNDVGNERARLEHAHRACLVAMRLGIQNFLQHVIQLADTDDVEQKTKALRILHARLYSKDIDATMLVLGQRLRYVLDAVEQEKVSSSYKSVADKLKEQLDIEKLASEQDTSYIIGRFFFEEDEKKKQYWWKVLEAKKEARQLKARQVDNPQGFCVDTLVALVENGPVWDGDIPSKSGRDSLINLGAAVRVLVKGEDGFTAATYLGRELYKFHFGNAASVEEAMTNRISKVAEGWVNNLQGMRKVYSQGKRKE